MKDYIKKYIERYYVGQPIVHKEERTGGLSYPSYSYVNWYDRIKTISEDGMNIETEAGFKLKISTAEYGDYGSLVFRGKKKNHGLVNDMMGKEMPHNLGAFYNNTPIFKMVLDYFTSEEEFEEYKKNRIKAYEEDLRYEKHYKQAQKNKKEKENEALKELHELKAKNNIIRDTLKKEENELHNKLIREKCKRIRVVDKDTDWIVCEEW